MNPTDSELLEVKNTLNSYKNKIVEGQELDKEKDALEIDIDGGRIWVHPKSDGTTVKIHYFNDTGDPETVFSGTGVIMHHINDEIGFPYHGKFEPFSSFFSNERRTHKIDFEYFRED